MTQLITDLRCDACFETGADHIWRGDVGLTHCPEHPEVELRPLDEGEEN